VAHHWIDETDKRVRSDSADYSAWWAWFKDPRLSDLIADAYRQNLTLRAVGYRVLEARANRAIAAGNLLPQSQAAFADFSRNRVSTQVANQAYTTESSYDLWDGGFNLSWELDFWGRFHRALEAADAELDASIENYDDALVTLVADVAVTYVEVRTLQQRLAFARANVEAQREALRIAKVNFKEGKRSEFDVQQARTNLGKTESQLPALETTLRQASNRLCVLMGTPPQDLQATLGEGGIPHGPTEAVVGIPADLLRRRPDVRRAERELAAQSARIGVATSDLYPRIALVGTIGIAADQFPDLFHYGSTVGSIGPSFRWNILNYGRLLNSIRVQDARFQRLAAIYQNTVLRANQEVEDALVGFLRAQQRNHILAESVSAASRAVDIVLVQYRENAVDFTSVFSAQESLAQQQDLLAQTEGEVSRNLIAIYRALGGGWQIRCNDEATESTLLRPGFVAQQAAIP
jgi:NodT family efflux transporter outer membrane factor (OMF) lipoprotein